MRVDPVAIGRDDHPHGAGLDFATKPRSLCRAAEGVAVRAFESQRSTRRRSTTGLVLVALGALCAFGPTLGINALDAYVARLHQAETARWIAAHVPRDVARSTDVITPGRDGYLLEIPRIGVQLVVHMLEPVVLSGVNTPTLRRYGAGQVPFTAALRDVSPGERGTTVIAGHRTTSGAPFRHLDALRPGDIIVLRQGTAIQQWRVEESAVISPLDLGAIRSRPGVRRLVLLACTPPFSARSRLMISARLAVSDAANANTMTGR
jgi:LPXTG-site transpeptidase (sortase) family protein